MQTETFSTPFGTFGTASQAANFLKAVQSGNPGLSVPIAGFGAAPAAAAPTAGMVPQPTRASGGSTGTSQNVSQSTSAPEIVPGMQGVYDQLLNLNQQNYQKVLD